MRQSRRIRAEPKWLAEDRALLLSSIRYRAADTARKGKLYGILELREGAPTMSMQKLRETVARYTPFKAAVMHYYIELPRSLLLTDSVPWKDKIPEGESVTIGLEKRAFTTNGVRIALPDIYGAKHALDETKCLPPEKLAEFDISDTHRELLRVVTSRMCEYPRRVAYPGETSDVPVFVMNVDTQFSYYASLEGSRWKQAKDTLPSVFSDETDLFNCKKFAAMFVDHPMALLVYLRERGRACSKSNDCSSCDVLTHEMCSIVDDEKVRKKWDRLSCEQKCALCLRSRSAPHNETKEHA